MIISCEGYWFLSFIFRLSGRDLLALLFHPGLPPSIHFTVHRIGVNNAGIAIRGQCGNVQISTARIFTVLDDVAEYPTCTSSPGL
jgi:hypothetical protein